MVLNSYFYKALGLSSKAFVFLCISILGILRIIIGKVFILDFMHFSSDRKCASQTVSGITLREIELANSRTIFIRVHVTEIT